ncbi:MAG: DUF1816 domain-containing protein [Gemmatimonadaceae bacterium]|nr:DUF1816 domain-containing protein [Gloeobacterales cyanobacterium ES-bin-141]
MHTKTGNAPDAGDGDWWLEMVTDEPFLYQFGPFDSAEDAAGSVHRHAPDLASEGWQIVGQKVHQQ